MPRIDYFDNSIDTMSSDDLIKNAPTPSNASAPADNTPAPGSIEMDLFTKSSDELIKNANQLAKDITGINPDDVTPDGVISDDKTNTATKGRPAKVKIEDSVKNTVSSLIEEGLLTGFEDGKYETLDDVKDLLIANKTSWQEEYAKTYNEEFYTSKGPIWSTILQLAETVRTPEEMIPFLTAADDYDYSQSLTTETEDQCEEIIRATLAIKGFDINTINADIADFKTRNILKERAEQFKPTLDNYNKEKYEALIYNKQQEELKNKQFYQNHLRAINESILQSKDIDGIKMKKEDRELIAGVLVPNQQLGGVPLYSIIDDLLSKGDFTKLAKIALIATKEDTFDNYYNAKISGNVSDSLQRKLRDSRSTTPTDQTDDDSTKQPVQGLQRPTSFSFKY